MTRNIALVGCGAIAQQFYLPAIASLRSELDQVWLVDPDQQSRSRAATMAVGSKSAPTLAEVADDLEFIVIATPNALHFSGATEALARGAHVLVEKPLALWPRDAEALVEHASSLKRTLAVNQTRRFFPAARELRRRIGAGEFGALLSGSHKEGEKLAWPFASGAAFAPNAKRTGVIMDLGVHVLDYHHYLLQPEWSVSSAVHDGFAGPEGLAAFVIRAGSARLEMRLSRYLRQENVVRLDFEKAVVEFAVYDMNRYEVTERDRGRATKSCSVGEPSSYNELAVATLRDFIAAASEQRRPVGDAASTLPVLRLLDRIYATAQLYPSLLGAV